MKQKTLAIYSDELGYANHLMDYLNLRKDIQMEIRMFTNQDSLSAYLDKGYIDILLLDKNLTKLEVDLSTISVVIHLIEERRNGREGEQFIYKYQKMKDIVKELFQILLQNSAIEEIGYESSGGEIIGIYTPYGDTELFASSMARLLGEKFSTLYVNMESYPIAEESQLGEDKPKGGLSDLLYFIHERKENFVWKLSTLVEKGEYVDRVLPIRNYIDLLDMRLEDMQMLLGELKNSSYEKIVLNINYLGESTYGLLEGCNEIFIPIWINKVSAKKIQTFKKYLEMEQRDGLEKRLHIVEIPVSSDSDHSRSNPYFKIAEDLLKEKSKE